MRVLVSGATGFVGRYLVEQLVSAGHEVVAAVRSRPKGDKLAGAIGWRTAILDPSLDQTEAFAGIDAFVHTAFDHLPGRFRGGEGDDPEGFLRRNREGSLALMAQAKTAGVRRAVFLSSRAVYGSAPGPVDEDEPALPDTLYGRMKLAVEAGLAAMAAPNFATVSLRVTGVYGSTADGGAGKWMQLFDQFMRGDPIEPRLATEVHGRDVGEAVRLVVEEPQASVMGEVYNVSDIVLDRADLLAIFREVLGVDRALPERAAAAPGGVMDCRKLRALGWTPGGLTLLDQTIRAMADRYRPR